MKKVKIKLLDNSFIYRVARGYQVGNFYQLVVRYKNSDYMIGDGDEYIRELPEYFALGKKLR